MDDLFYAYDEFQKLYLKNYFPRDLEVISVRYINKFIPKLIFPALSIGIFFEYFLIWLSSFFVNPVVPITTFFNFDAILRTSNVHLGTVKSIIKFTLFKSFFSISSLV